MFRISFTLIIFLFLGNSFSATGQTSKNNSNSVPKKTSQTAEDKTPEVTKTQALEIIYSEIGGAKYFPSEKDKLTVWTYASDVIWDADAERAKETILSAYKRISNVAAPKQEGESDTANALRTADLQKLLRTEILSVVNKHDSKLFNELIGKDKEDEAQLKELHNTPQLLGSSSSQQKSLMSLAVQVAPSDPQRAIELAVKSLDYGIPSEISVLFRILTAVDPALSQDLFARSTRRFLADGSNNLYDAVILGGYLRTIPASEVNRELARDLLSEGLARATRVWLSVKNSEERDEATIGSLMFSIQNLYDLYQLYLPERSSEVRLLFNQITEATKNEENKLNESASDDSQKDSVEKLLEKAEKTTNDEDRDALYFEAAFILSRRNEHIRAISIARRAADNNKRQSVLNYLRNKYAVELIKQKEPNDAEKIISLIDDPEIRAELTVAFAKKFKDKQFDYITIEVFEETRKLLEKNPNSAAHGRAYLWMASAYSTFDAKRALILMYDAVRMANKAKELSDFRSETKLLRLSPKSNQVLSIGTAQGNFLNGFTQLSKSNFQQTLLIARLFENKLFASLAAIAAAKPYLLNQKKSS